MRRDFDTTKRCNYRSASAKFKGNTECTYGIYQLESVRTLKTVNTKYLMHITVSLVPQQASHQLMIDTLLTVISFQVSSFPRASLVLI